MAVRATNSESKSILTADNAGPTYQVKLRVSCPYVTAGSRVIPKAELDKGRVRKERILTEQSFGEPRKILLPGSLRYVGVA